MIDRTKNQLFLALAKKDTANDFRNKLDRLIERTNELLATLTWPGWVDHGVLHISNVVKRVDEIIPVRTKETLTADELFMLLASAILHDIGMAPIHGLSLTEIRNQHGKLGANLINNQFAEIIHDPQLLAGICDLVRNHHGSFKSNEHFAHLALMVRFADGLDFGPSRAPEWVFHLLNLQGETAKYWKEHHGLREPVIDSHLFRIIIEITGNAPTIINPIIQNFEENNFKYIQNNFFNRGASDSFSKSYVVIFRQDTTGEDEYRSSLKPTHFFDENYLIAARYLYNVANYDAAERCFEETVTKRYGGNWSQEPCKTFFYHYLQTKNKLKKYNEVINLCSKYGSVIISPEEKAAMYITKGIAYLKTNDLDSAYEEFLKASENYQNLENEVNKADSTVWILITKLEKYRVLNRPLDESFFDSIRKVETIYSKAKRVHYEGRFRGLKAFYLLTQIEAKKDKKLDDWKEPLQDAAKAYGGNKKEDRVPFGIMSGKYCEAAVYFHRYKHCIEGKLDSLDNSQSSILEVIDSYDNIYRNKKIDWTSNKIVALACAIQNEIKTSGTGITDKIKKMFDDLKLPALADPIPENVQIFTPLN
jgi:tetratricopeptide (TPR) repeat protein